MITFIRKPILSAVSQKLGHFLFCRLLAVTLRCWHPELWTQFACQDRRTERADKFNIEMWTFFDLNVVENQPASKCTRELSFLPAHFPPLLQRSTHNGRRGPSGHEQALSEAIHWFGEKDSLVNLDDDNNNNNKNVLVWDSLLTATAAAGLMELTIANNNTPDACKSRHLKASKWTLHRKLSRHLCVYFFLCLYDVIPFRSFVDEFIEYWSQLGKGRRGAPGLMFS